MPAVIPLPPWDDLAACATTLTELPQGDGITIAAALIERWQRRPPVACLEVPWHFILATSPLYGLRLRVFTDLLEIGQVMQDVRPWPRVTAPWLLPTWCPHQMRDR